MEGWMMGWLRRKMEKWSIANEEAAERSKARRLLLESTQKEMIENEKAIARADKLLLDEKFRKLDEKIKAAEKKAKG
jgi:hypothetical protein